MDHFINPIIPIPIKLAPGQIIDQNKFQLNNQKKFIEDDKRCVNCLMNFYCTNENLFEKKICYENGTIIFSRIENFINNLCLNYDSNTNEIYVKIIQHISHLNFLSQCMNLKKNMIGNILILQSRLLLTASSIFEMKLIQSSIIDE